MLFKKGDNVFIPVDDSDELYAVGTVTRFRVEVKLPDGTYALRSPEDCFLIADKEVAIPCRPQNL